MPFVDVGERRIYYEEHGAADAEALVCIAGLSADHLSWLLQIGPFSQHFRTIVFDNRDAGQSTYADGPYEISDMAGDTLALADALELDRFHLLGMSMGGAIAQETALAAPERIETLTLVVTWAGGGAWQHRFAELWARRIPHLTRDEHIDELLLYSISEEFWENEAGMDYLRRTIHANPHPQAPEAFVRQLDAASRHEARDRLPGLDLPVHVIGAEHDILVPIWKSRELASLIPGARLSIVERAPHGLNVERAEELTGLVLDFLQARTAAS